MDYMTQKIASLQAQMKHDKEQYETELGRLRKESQAFREYHELRTSKEEEYYMLVNAENKEPLDQNSEKNKLITDKRLILMAAQKKEIHHLSREVYRLKKELSHSREHRGSTDYRGSTEQHVQDLHRQIRALRLQGDKSKCEYDELAQHKSRLEASIATYRQVLMGGSQSKAVDEIMRLKDELGHAANIRVRLEDRLYRMEASLHQFRQQPQMGPPFNYYDDSHSGQLHLTPPNNNSDHQSQQNSRPVSKKRRLSPTLSQQYHSAPAIDNSSEISFVQYNMTQPPNTAPAPRKDQLVYDTNPPPQSFSWQTERRTQSFRKEMISKISEVLHRRKQVVTDEWLQKLPVYAQRLETFLYRSASSFEDYRDESTLTQRLERLALMRRMQVLGQRDLDNKVVLH